MTPERRKYALMRLERLRDKLVRLKTYALSADVRWAIASTRVAISRWEAELRDADGEQSRAD